VSEPLCSTCLTHRGQCSDALIVSQVQRPLLSSTRAQKLMCKKSISQKLSLPALVHMINAEQYVQLLMDLVITNSCKHRLTQSKVFEVLKAVRYMQKL
jgi:hypothetical protein